MQISEQSHRFFHADRNASLVEGKILELNEYGASNFGCSYWPKIGHTPLDQLDTLDENHLREYILEYVRQHNNFNLYPSRRQVFFAANTIEEAAKFGHEILPTPDYDVPIFEILASKFWTLDMTWLDIRTDRDFPKMVYHAQNYWLGNISNHYLPNGVRVPPRPEVLILLPAQVGKKVGYVSKNGVFKSS